MVKVFNIFNVNVFIFLLVVFIVILLLIFYNIITPSNNPNKINDFQPYPQISPKDLPDPTGKQKTCYDKLTSCDANGNCNSCDQNFSCVEVDEYSNLFFHDEKVPPGKWCLPTIPTTEECNSYTGKWIWSNDPGCKVKTGSDQCWTCKCLYPNLFNGGDCSTQIACKALDNTIDSISLQKCNYLVSTQALFNDNNKIPVGTVWDPTQKQSNGTPEWLALQYSPYSQSSSKQPYFSCNCGGNCCTTDADCANGINKSCRNGQCTTCTSQGAGTETCDVKNNPYLNLPSDPYMCHINPCGKVDGYSSSPDIKTDIVNGKYNCMCDDSGFTKLDEKYNIPKDNVNYGTCASPLELPCNYDITHKECICNKGYNRQCKTTKINTASTFPSCQDPDNLIGYECFDPSNGENCNYRGFPEYKTGTCSNIKTNNCISNSQCPGGTCLYPDKTSCNCASPCADIQLVYGQSSGKVCNNDVTKTCTTDPDCGPGNKCIPQKTTVDDTSLESMCNKYSDVCSYDKAAGKCNPLDLNNYKPFVECDNPYYGNDKCQNFYCADSSQISCIDRIDPLDVTSHIDNNKLALCKNPNFDFSKNGWTKRNGQWQGLCFVGVPCNSDCTKSIQGN